MVLLAFHIAFAHNNARPERREIKNATFVRSVVHLFGCISMKSTTCKRKPPHSAVSPAYEAGIAMGQTEAD